MAHSMAAGEAVRYLSRHGDDRVSGLVVVGGTTPCLVATDDNPSGVARELLGASTELLRTDRAGWFRAGTPAYFGRPDAEPLTPWMQDGLDMCLQTPLPVLLACSQTMVDADLRSDVRGVRVPTLVVHGDTDASAPLAVTGAPTADLLPHGRLLVYAGAPHGLYRTEQGRLNDDLLAFVGELPARVTDAGAGAVEDIGSRTTSTG